MKYKQIQKINMSKLISKDFIVKINKKNSPVMKKILIFSNVLKLKIFFNTNNQKKVSYNSNALGIPNIIILGSGINLFKYSTYIILNINKLEEMNNNTKLNFFKCVSFLFKK